MKKNYLIILGIFFFFNVNAQLDTITSFNQHISDLEVFNGKLFIGGNFTKNKGTDCYWTAFYDGSNITPHTNLIGGGGAREFAVFDNDLYNVGSMQFPGSIGVAVWTGTTWDNGGSSTNNHITIYSDNTKLYVVSSQGLIRSKTPGGEWTTFYDFAGTGGIGDIIRFGGDLIFIGSFTEIDGIPANYIAKWNGSSWSALGDGLDDSGGNMIVYNNELYVCGDFTLAGGVSVNGIAKWDGSSWSDVGGGLAGSTFGGGITDMVVHNGRLYVSGRFDVIGGTAADDFAYWDGSTWTGINYAHPELELRCIAVYNNEIYLGGFDFNKSYLYRYSGSLDVPENSMDNGIWLYPNPSDGTFTIKGDNGKSEYEYRVLNTLGKEISQGVGFNINISGFEDGLYYVQISMEDRIQTMKIVKR